MTPDNLDSASAPEVGERRDHAAQLAWMRKVLRYQQMTILALVVVLFVHGWSWWNTRTINTYLNCVSLYGQGIVAPECDPYRAYIGKTTNVKNPGGNLDARDAKK